MSLVNYANMPMYYTATFHGYKYDSFQMKNVHVSLFLLTLEIVGTRYNGLSEAVLTSTNRLCQRSEQK